MNLEERVKRLERSNSTTTFANIALGAMCIFVIVWLVLSAFINISKNGSDQTINFNITGIVNSTNTTTIAQIHFECIKYCIGHTNVDYYSDCWKECSTLGSEASIDNYYTPLNQRWSTVTVTTDNNSTIAPMNCYFNNTKNISGKKK
jgi:hypothetical protein